MSAITAPDSSGGPVRTELARRLSLGDSIAIVVGIMIGGGIFLVPNLVARSVPSMPMIMGVWILAGVVSFLGALACAELGAAFPATGGQYVFLREAYGPVVAFLCGWSLFTVARSAQVAWLSVLLWRVMQFGLKPLTADLGRAIPHHNSLYRLERSRSGRRYAWAL